MILFYLLAPSILIGGPALGNSAQVASNATKVTASVVTDELRRAAQCLKRSDYPCAEAIYREILGRKQGHAAAYFGLAEIGRLQNKPNTARAFYKQYLASKLAGRTPEYDAQAQQYLDKTPPRLPKRRRVPPPLESGCATGMVVGAAFGAAVSVAPSLLGSFFTPRRSSQSVGATTHGLVGLVFYGGIRLAVGGLVGGGLGFVVGCARSRSH